MTIMNISQKIINIGASILMPDESMTVSKATADTPAIKAMSARGQLVIKGDSKAGDDSALEVAGKEGHSEKVGEGGSDEKKPVYRMNKAELVEECQRLGIEIGPDDTNPTIMEKIKAATAE